MLAERGVTTCWVDTAGGATLACAEIARHPVVGYDSEFYGVDLSHESCVGRAVVDVFSFAVPSGALNALGFHEPRSWVFDAPLLLHPDVRTILENPGQVKAIHNMPVDAHAAANVGVHIRGGVNTLDMARWIYPERANLIRGNFDLNSLCEWRVGRGKTEDFADFLMYDALEPVTEEVVKNYCQGCHSFDCRKKKEPHDWKMPMPTVVTRQKKVRRAVHLPDVRPGGPYAGLFDRYVRYAAVDAELALIIYEMMLRDGRKERRYPWG